MVVALATVLVAIFWAVIRSYVSHVLIILVYCYYQGDGRHLITNAKDQTIKLWDMRKFSSEEGISVSLDSFLRINVRLKIFAGPRDAHNPNLDSDQRLRIACTRHFYNRDTETGSWKFVVPLRAIRMQKMCQSQQFVT